MINLIYTDQIINHNNERRNTFSNHITIEDILNLTKTNYSRYTIKQCLDQNIKGVTFITTDLCRLNTDSEFEEIFNQLLSADILSGINDGLLKLIIFDASSTRESFSGSRFLIRLKNYLLKKQFNNNNCTIVTNIKDINLTPFSTLSWEFFETVIYCSFLKNEIEIDIDRKIANFNTQTFYRFLCLNAKPRFHRYLLMYNLYKKCKNFKEQFNFSLRAIDIDGLVWNLKRYQSDIFKTYIDSKKLLQMLSFLKTLPAFTKEEGEISKHNLWSRIDSLIKTLYNTGVDIVTETTLTYDSRHFITEKTFRPIAAKMPFIVCGQAGLLKELQMHGYKTFSKYWDESYDDEICAEKRVLKVVNTVLYLSNLPQKEFIQILHETKNIVEYNYNHFWSVRNPKEICKITNLLYH